VRIDLKLIPSIPQQSPIYIPRENGQFSLDKNGQTFIFCFRTESKKERPQVIIDYANMAVVGNCLQTGCARKFAGTDQLSVFVWCWEKTEV
jgi:hypothetical protein